MMMLKILSRLPFWVLYGLSDFIFVVGFYIIRYRRNIVKSNLVHSFPQKTPIEIERIERKFYKSLCDYAVETLALLTISKEELSRRMIYKNPDLIRPFTDNHKSVILFASHLFNWEWLLAAGCFSLPVDIDFVYQAQSSDLFNRFLLFCRTRFGAHPIQREYVARQVMKRRDRVRGIAIIADQFPGLASDKRYWTNFLHQDTAFFQAINQVAVLTQYPAFFADVRKVKRGFYEIELVKIAEPPFDRKTFHVVDNYANVTEAVIARQPENWLWSHKRWKKPRPSSE
jgi:Kdo2-lipid IVA lauroyltransferase/acyltransferase